VIKTRLQKGPGELLFSSARKRRLLRAGLPVLALIAGMFVFAAPSTATSVDRSVASPELVIDGTRKDFGEIFVGEELDHIFTVRNVGTAPLELANKTLTGLSSRPSLVTASSESSFASGGSFALANYLKPARAVNRLAAPT
jgi:hypothetical protein